MSLVNYYKCDVCNKKYKLNQLHRFEKINTCFLKNPIYRNREIRKSFDMCEKCLARIVSEIKKEGAE